MKGYYRLLFGVLIASWLAVGLGACGRESSKLEQVKLEVNDCSKSRNCSKTMRALMVELIDADVQAKLAAAGISRTLLSQWATIYLTPNKREIPFKILKDVAETLVKNSTHTLSPTKGLLLDEMVMRKAEEHAKIYLLEYCDGTELTDCPD